MSPEYGKFKYAESKYGASWQLKITELINNYKGFRFNCFLNSQGTAFVDKDILSADITVYLKYLIEGLLVMWDSNSDMLFIMSPLFDDLQSSDLSSITLRESVSDSDLIYLSGQDFLDGQRIVWNWGFVPFDVSLLLKTGVTGNWTGQAGVETIWTALGDTVYETVNSGTLQTVMSGLPAGSYRAFILINETGTGTGTIVTTGALKNGSTSYSLSGEEWATLDFIAESSDSVTFTITKTTGTRINCGEILLVPLTNSKNFPLDVVHQATNIENILESL